MAPRDFFLCGGTSAASCTVLFQVLAGRIQWIDSKLSCKYIGLLYLLVNQSRFSIFLGNRTLNGGAIILMAIFV